MTATLTSTKPRAKRRGPKRKFTAAEAGQRKLDQTAERQAKDFLAARDIAPLPTKQINWKRRLSTVKNLKKFCEIYLPAVFDLAWGADHLRCIKKIKDTILGGGQFALAMPRGGGKTALCRGGILWASVHGHRRFLFFLSATSDDALQTLELIKGYWYRSAKLQQDFPEIAHAFGRLNNQSQKAKGQTFDGENTHVEWGAASIRYPCLLLSKETAEPYLKKCPDFLTWLPQYKKYLPKSSGTILITSGIDGAIRGKARIHPITLEQMRPDLILLDDIQSDLRAESPASVAKIIRRIEGTIEGLAGPGKSCAKLMPCTVTCPDDLSDTFLNQDRMPQWGGERCSMVTNWPKGITDQEITNETKAGKLWNEYAEVRVKSFKLYKDNRRGTKLYEENRRAMDRGFRVSWDDRYERGKEISPQQCAMNLRLKYPDGFLSEYQNQPRAIDADQMAFVLRPSQLAERTTATRRREIPAECQNVTAFIDVQNEILMYTVLATSPDFSGVFCDYGTWPHVSNVYFQRRETENWSKLTKAFFDKYPEQRKNALRIGGRIRAPLKDKIYFALGEACDYIFNLPLIRTDGTPATIDRLGIDFGWGKVTSTIKRFCREYGKNNVIPYFGHPMLPTHKQFEDYERLGKYRSWTFEDSINPQIAECKWVFKPEPSGQRVMMADVNRLKSFLHSRLSAPMGTSGAITLFAGEPLEHQMFTQHVCNSEYPTMAEGRGLRKEIWLERAGRPDNDYFDCAVGCCALAGMLGTAVTTTRTKTIKKTKRKKRKWSDVFAEKAAKRNR